MPTPRQCDGLTLNEIDALAQAALARDREAYSLASLLDEVELGPQLRWSLTEQDDADDGVFATVETLPYRGGRRR